jgi:hypothetical protein
MVRPDRITLGDRRGSRCIELAGASPAAVSAGAPCSRPRASRETAPSEWGVKSPHGASRLHGGEQVRRPSIKRTLQPRERSPRKGEVGRAAHVTAKAIDCTCETGWVQDASGVWRRACGDSSVRNRRDPSRRPVGGTRCRATSSGVGGPYKPTVKGDRVGRESEGSIVPRTPVEKAGRGKGPCFGRGGVRR